MNELTIISKQEAGIASIENFEELKNALQQELSIYKNIVYTPDNIKVAKKDKASLNKLRKAIEDRRKDIKRIIMEPYILVEAQTKELVALVDEPLTLISSFIAQEEEQEKKIRHQQIEEYFYRIAEPLGEMANSLWNSPAFYEKKWDAKSTSAKNWQDAVKDKVLNASRDISSIRLTGGKYTAALLERYISNLSMEGLADYKNTLNATETATETATISNQEEDQVKGYKILKLKGTKQQLLQIMDQMELLGIEIDEIEDGMPQDMTELSSPDFNSFVAFDIETTGTFGAANGDAPPEITEIGAVKVINGTIVDHFSQLANPRRKIVPRIAKLTHITDEMLENEPPINEVIKAFKDFVGDSILVGHNIKNCDIPYIVRAAKKAGVAFENSYFDTYRYAKVLKDANSWENVKLEYLSKQFDIEQPDAHRAWCDAEANVGVYFKLKEKGGF